MELNKANSTRYFISKYTKVHSCFCFTLIEPFKVEEFLWSKNDWIEVTWIEYIKYKLFHKAKDGDSIYE